ncbi:MAG: CoA ester lyase [Leptothrix sp. (in: Bacteria)]|nr:CoA ester lyase [Leptothrix sp. (in: b-proteobacteria)]
MAKVEARLPRSYLFVPGDRPERFAKALASGADAVVIDLEDAVVAAAKSPARMIVAQWLAAAPERDRVLVRINDESTPWFAADVAMLAASGAAAVMLPKAEAALPLADLRDACPGITLLPLVETARGMLVAGELAAATGVQRLVFGTIDYALDLDLGDALGQPHPALDHAAAHLALVSRAAGIASPVAGVTAAIGDEVQLLADLARARLHGFGAKLCIHPLQVATVHDALAPGAAELEWAVRVLQAAAAAQAAGQGAVQLDGRMIDKPVIERARRTVGRAG